MSQWVPDREDGPGALAWGQYRAVVDASMDAVVVIDAEGRVLEWNPAAESIFGYTAAEVVDRELATLIIPEELREAHRQGLARAVVGRRGPLVGRHAEVMGQRADGTQFPVELTITWIGGHGQRAVFSAFLRDITERRRLIAELAASRTRLVAVADEARRRMERDLHDGAQQRLVALAIVLSGLETGADGRGTAATSLATARELVAAAIRDLRDLARGIHPAVLTEHGLAAAVQELGRRSTVEVDLQVEVAGRLRAEAEVAAYYVVAEALTNAAKYGAGRVMVRIRTEAGSAGVLACTVSDDGPGGASPARGSGLRGLADRVGAAGGQFSVSSPVGGGTVVAASIPTEPR